jgi:hypothetical protein
MSWPATWPDRMPRRASSPLRSFPHLAYRRNNRRPCEASPKAPRIVDAPGLGGEMAPPRRGSLTIPPGVVGSRKSAPSFGSLSVPGVGAFATLSTSDSFGALGTQPEPGHGVFQAGGANGGVERSRGRDERWGRRRGLYRQMTAGSSTKSPCPSGSEQSEEDKPRSGRSGS